LLSLFLVDIELGIGNFYAALIENLLGGFEKVEVYCPVIFRFHPYAEVENKRGIAMFTKADEWSRVFEHELVSICEVQKRFLNGFNIRVI